MNQSLSDPSSELTPPCRYCGSVNRPLFSKELGNTGIIVMVALLFFCFPIFWIGLFIKDEVWRCPDCHGKVT